MNLIETLQHPLWQNLGLSLLHFLWQGAAIIALTVIVIHALGLRHGGPRYAAYLVAMIALAGAPIITFSVISKAAAPAGAIARGPERELTDAAGAMPSAARPASQSAGTQGLAPVLPLPDHVSLFATSGEPATAGRTDQPPAASSEPTALSLDRAALESARVRLQRIAPWAVSVWLLGVSFFGTRLLTGAFVLLKLRRTARPLPAALAARIRGLTGRIGMSGFDGIFMTSALRRPVAMGLLRPMVLLPASMMTSLAPATLEAIIAHELAHLRRHDPWIILLQRLIEALLFFHPLVWYCSRQLSVQRELCCDNAAADAIGERDAYAEALELAARHDLDQRGLALAAALGRRGALLQRVQHLLGVASPTSRTAWPAGLIVLLILAAGISLTLSAQRASADDEALKKGTITIRVLEDETGDPIADAAVTMETGFLDEVEATTDERGVHVFDVPEGTIASLAVTVGAPGRVPQRQRWRREGLNLEIPDECTLRLPLATTVSGIFLDEHGSPVEGVRVWTTVQDRDTTTFVNQIESAADHQGRWQCDLVPQDLEKLLIGYFHPDYACRPRRMPSQFKDSTTPAIDDFLEGTATIVLQEGATVEGVVRSPDGSPATGLDVGFKPAESLGPSGETMTETDSEGRFRFTIDPEPIIVMVQADGCMPAYESINPGQAEALEIQLERGRVIRGRVMGDAREPVAGAIVYRSATMKPYMSWKTRTDKSGRFVCDVAGPGITEFSVHAPGYMVTRTVELLPAEEEHVVALLPELVVRGRVYDKATGDSIEQFTLIEGREREHGPDFSGLSQYVSQHAGGEFLKVVREVVPDAHLFKVEAEGYLAAVSRAVKSDEGEVTLKFALESGTGPTGRVVTPGGKPAAGADVVLSFRPSMRVFELGGHDRDHVVAQTDKDGRFQHQPQADPYALAVVHDQGFAVLDQAEAEAGGLITLQPWARVEGTYLIGEKPVADASIKLRLFDPAWYLRDAPPSFSFGTHATTDENGRFAFDRVHPGLGSVVRYQSQPGLSVPIASTRFEVASGETARVQLGGTGRPVVGRVTLPSMASDDLLLNHAESRLELERLDLPYPDDWEEWTAEQKGRWYKEFPESVAGEAFYRKQFQRMRTYGFHIEPDGSFRIEDVRPGEYVLEIKLIDPLVRPMSGSSSILGSLRHEFELIAPENKLDPEPFDLGTHEITVFTNLKAGEPAPAFECATIDGQNFSLSEFRGKYVLLDFWATWCGPCVAETPHLKKVYEQFGDDDRFVMIGLSSDREIEPLRAYVAEKDLAWTQCFLEGETKSNILHSYGIRGIPQIMLIGPDGRVIAKDLRGDAIISAVQSALNAHHAPVN